MPARMLIRNTSVPEMSCPRFITSTAAPARIPIGAIAAPVARKTSTMPGQLVLPTSSPIRIAATTR
jgi:hypothetical protein